MSCATGRHAQHDREKNVGDHHHDLPIALGELRSVVLDLGQRRESDALHGLHRRNRRLILELDRLIERAERIGRIEPSEEKLRNLIVERRNQVRGDQAETEGSHFAQRSAAARPAGPPVAQPPQQQSPHRRLQHALGHDTPDPEPASARPIAASPPASDEAKVTFDNSAKRNFLTQIVF